MPHRGTARKLPRVRAPAQARSRDSLERTVVAVEALLRERLFDDITVTDIVRRAGTSVGSFYQRFGTKENIVPYLLARHLDTQVEQSATLLGDAERWSGVGLRDRIKLLVQGAVGGLREGRGLYRALFVRGIVRPREMSREERARQTEVLDAVVAWLLECDKEIQLEDPELSVRFAVTSLYAMANLNVLFDDVPSRALGALPDAALAEQLEQQMALYLGVEGKPGKAKTHSRRRARSSVRRKKTR